jgi:hypothetical protein
LNSIVQTTFIVILVSIAIGIPLCCCTWAPYAA